MRCSQHSRRSSPRRNRTWTNVDSARAAAHAAAAVPLYDPQRAAADGGDRLQRAGRWFHRPRDRRSDLVADDVQQEPRSLVEERRSAAFFDAVVEHASGASITQCGVTTDTAILAGTVAPVSDSFLRPVTSVGRIAFEWDEVAVAPTSFTAAWRHRRGE